MIISRNLPLIRLTMLWMRWVMTLRKNHDRRYDERLRNEGRNDILAYGIAFCKKKCKVVVERL